MNDTYECPWCSTLFKAPSTGVIACPNCGGPKPKRIVTEVFERVRETYVYVSTGPTDYYRNPSPTFSEQVYDTFGYKVVSGIFLTGVLAFLVFFLYMWFFHRTGAPKDIDPRYQNIIPTAVATVTPYQDNNPWQNTQWLNTEEALALRTQENAINLAYLERGGAKYTTISVVFISESWQMTKPLGVTEKTVNGTTVKLKINGDEYYLNVYQPFVIKGQENTLFLVDRTGQIWKIDLTSITLVDLETAQNNLPVVISPNPRLNSTY